MTGFWFLLVWLVFFLGGGGGESEGILTCIQTVLYFAKVKLHSF